MKKILITFLILFLSKEAFSKPSIQNADVKGLSDITAAVLTTTGNLTISNACITSVGSLTGLAVGQFIYDTTTPARISAATTIAGLPGTCSAGQIQMSSAAVSSATGDTITFGGQMSQLVNTSKIYDSFNSQLLSTSISNGTFGSVGITTDWVANNNFLINNTGTNTSQSFFSRRVGDTICLQGTITPGTGTGSVATVSFPSGIVLDSTKMSSGNTQIGLWVPTTGGTSQLFASNVTNIVFYDGSDTAHLYFSPKSNTSSYFKALGSDISFTSPTSIGFCFPVVGWSSSTATTNVVNARYTNSATSLSGSLATISWTNKSYDSDNAMSSGTYTVATAEGGKFHVDSAVTVGGTVALNNNVDMQLQVNGTAICEDLEDAGGVITTVTAQVHCDFAASAGDTIRVQVSSSITSPSITSSVSRNFFNLFRNSQ